MPRRSSQHTRTLVLALSCGSAVCLSLLMGTPSNAQVVQLPPANGLRPIQSGTLPSTQTPTMVPINPSGQPGFSSTLPSGQAFDAFSTNNYAGGVGAPILPSNVPGGVVPGGGLQGGAVPGAGFGGNPGSYGSSPTVGANNFGNYTGVPPSIPGSAQSGIVGSFPNYGSVYNQPGALPNSAPSALYPGAANSYGAPGQYPGAGALNSFNDYVSNIYNGVFGNASVANVYSTAPGVYPPASPGTIQPNLGGWNPPGTVFATGTSPQFIRLFQGIRFRHSYIFSRENQDSLAINDTDLSLAVVFPNFLWSTQPLFLMPSFSLHQWSGPRAPATADLPAVAYSAFLDTGWQSDTTRILGAELGVRVGMFSDFNANSSDSLRVMGRGIGRVRITPRSTLKLGVLYLDRNRIKLLPAGGLLWEPNEQTRFDLFFPEPKLAHYLSTVGTLDTWWYVGGYYGGGNWTIERADMSKDQVDINDIRLVLGVEWGRNDLMRIGRRFGFFEVGFVFDRELVYRNPPMLSDNMDLEDSIIVRAGIGY